MRATPWKSKILVESHKRDSFSTSKEVALPKKYILKRDLVVAIPPMNSSLDQLYHIAVLAVLEYDKSYRHVCDLVKSGCTKYATAVLYQDRFHAFDAFGNAVVTLTERTVEAITKISEWRDSSREDLPAQSRIFVWNGQNFAVCVRSSFNLRCVEGMITYRLFSSLLGP